MSSLGLGLGVNRFFGKGQITPSLSTLFRQRVLEDNGTFEGKACLQDLINQGLFDNDNFVLTPNGYKAGKLYALKPENGDLDVTWVRNGNATRVNQNGLIESVGNNVPRLDYLNGNCPSILVEPQRTNLNANNNLNTITNNVFSGSSYSNKEVLLNELGVLNMYLADQSPQSSLNAATFFNGSNNFNAFETITTDFILRRPENENWDFFGLNLTFVPIVAVVFDLNNLTFVSSSSVASNINIVKLNETDFYISINMTSDSDTFSQFSQYRIGIADGLNTNPSVIGGRFGISGFSFANDNNGLQSIIPTTGSAVTRPSDAPIPIPVPAGTTEIVEVMQDETINIITNLLPTYTIPFGRFKYILFNGA